MSGQRPVLDPLPDLVGELGGHDALLAQRPEPLERDRDGQDRAQDDRHHHDAAGRHDFEHVRACTPRVLRPRMILHRGPRTANAAPFRGRARDAAGTAATAAAAPIGCSGCSSNSMAPVAEPTSTCGTGRLPARHHVGLGEAPAIAMARTAPAPSAAASRRRMPWSTTCDCRGAAPAARPRAAPRPASSSSASASRSTSPVSSTACGPARTSSTHERSLSFGRQRVARVQPLEAHAVPGPAHAAPTALDRAERVAAPCRSRPRRRRAAGAPPTRHRRRGRGRRGSPPAGRRAAQAAMAQVGLDHHGAGVAAAAERWPASYTSTWWRVSTTAARPCPTSSIVKRAAPGSRHRWSPQASGQHQQQARHAPGRRQRRQRSRRTDARARPTPTARGPPRPRWPTTTRPARRSAATSSRSATPRHPATAVPMAGTERSAAAVPSSTAGTISSVYSGIASRFTPTETSDTVPKLPTSTGTSPARHRPLRRA